MSQALFALAGAFVGVLGTVLTALVSGRHEERRIWHETLRSIVASLTSEVSLLRDLSHQLHWDPEDPDLRRAAEQAHTRARSFQEQLRLTSRSTATQEAARWLVHCAYHQWKVTQGGRGDFWEARRALDRWLTRLYIETRKELGLGASGVYEDPDGALPIPGAQEGSRTNDQKHAGQADGTS
jgi:hypothetical protein